MKTNYFYEFLKKVDFVTDNQFKIKVQSQNKKGTICGGMFSFGVFIVVLTHLLIEISNMNNGHFDIYNKHTIPNKDEGEIEI